MVVVFLMLVVVGASVIHPVVQVVRRRVGDRVGVHVHSRWVLGSSAWLVGLDVSSEAVLVSDVVHVSVDPVGILVPIGALDLVVTQALLVPVLVVPVAIVHVVPEAVRVVRMMLVLVVVMRRLVVVRVSYRQTGDQREQRDHLRKQRIQSKERCSQGR